MVSKALLFGASLLASSSSYPMFNVAHNVKAHNSSHPHGATPDGHGSHRRPVLIVNHNYNMKCKSLGSPTGQGGFAGSGGTSFLSSIISPNGIDSTPSAAHSNRNERPAQAPHHTSFDEQPRISSSIGKGSGPQDANFGPTDSIKLSWDSLPVSETERILATPGAKISGHWSQQCYNDRISNCGPGIVNLGVHLLTKSKLVEERLKLVNWTPPQRPEHRTIYAMVAILANHLPPLSDERIPYHSFAAVELLLGMGFTPSATAPTSVTNRVVNLSPIIKSKGQLLTHLGPIARLGFHRLASALLDLPGITFTSDDPELRHLLTEAREQPYVLSEFLKRVHNENLRQILALGCPQCSQLATAIHRSLAITIGGIPPLCVPNGSTRIHSVHTNFLESIGKSTEMKRRDHVMLARSFLYLVFNVPLTATYCPRCLDKTAVPHMSPAALVNAMLQCYCTPRSRFRIAN